MSGSKAVFSISSSHAMPLRQRAGGVVSNAGLVCHSCSLCVSCVSLLVMMSCLSLIPLTNIPNKFHTGRSGMGQFNNVIKCTGSGGRREPALQSR